MNEIIEKTSSDIFNYIDSLDSKSTTSWDIKLRFKLPSSVLYMCIGYLIANKKISVANENLIYRVKIHKQDVTP